MPKTPQMRAVEAESLLLQAGFELLRTKGSHRIYLRGNTRIVIPFHAGRDLHPKVVRRVLDAVREEP